MRAELPLLIAVVVASLPSVMAHPVSHTDAWVTVSDVVSVRLKVFLDDVARHQLNLAPGQTRIDAEEMQAAVVRHTPTLLKQLRLFQEGVPLTGAAVTLPKWRPDSAEVDLESDASLKLTWDLQFSLTSTDPKSLCFLHQFTHSSLVQPGELRMNLRRSGSDRRIAAVIPPGKPHTMVLPTLSSADQGVFADPNSVSSTWIVSPAAVIHEFRAPLLLLDEVWPEAREFRRALADRSVVAVSPATVRAIRGQFTKWYRTNIHVQGDSADVQPNSIVVEFFSDSGLEDSVPEDRDMPVFGCFVGIRAAYPAHIFGQKVAFAVDTCPGLADDLLVTVVQGGGQYSELVSFSGGQDIAETHRPALQYEWEPDAESRLPLADRPLRINSEFLSEDLVRIDTVRPGRTGSLAGLCFAAVVLLICFRKWRTLSASFRALLSVAAAAGFVVCRAVIPDAALSADDRTAEVVVERLLTGVYDSVLNYQQRDSVAQLSRYLDDDLVEAVYLATVASLVSAETGEVFVDLTSVSVDGLTSSAPDSRETLETDCSWRVSGTVHHWGHSHRRVLVSAGRISLIRDRGLWKISRISLSQAGTIVDPDAGDGRT